jgi:hypothetical protein
MNALTMPPCRRLTQFLQGITITMPMVSRLRWLTGFSLFPHCASQHAVHCRDQPACASQNIAVYMVRFFEGRQASEQRVSR